MIKIIKKTMKRLKFLVDSIKVVVAIYTFLGGLTAYNAYASYEKDKEIGYAVKQVHEVAKMIKPESYGYKPNGYKTKPKTIVINNCGTICAKLVLEHSESRQH